MAAAIPPTSSKMVLSAGEPVNARDTSELNDPEALIPQKINTIPTTNNATEMLLFIYTFLKCDRYVLDEVKLLLTLKQYDIKAQIITFFPLPAMHGSQPRRYEWKHCSPQADQKVVHAVDAEYGEAGIAGWDISTMLSGIMLVGNRGLPPYCPLISVDPVFQG